MRPSSPENVPRAAVVESLARMMSRRTSDSRDAIIPRRVSWSRSRDDGACAVGNAHSGKCSEARRSPPVVSLRVGLSAIRRADLTKPHCRLARAYTSTRDSVTTNAALEPVPVPAEK